MTPKLLRGLAILIAIAGAIDPAVTSERRTKPEIAIVAAHEKDDELARQVADTLSRDFTIVRGPYTAAAAVVAVGETLSPASVAFPDSVPAFAVLPTPTASLATIEAVRVPARAPLNARVPVTAVVRARGARSRSVHVSLLSNDIVIDRASRPVGADDERIEMTLGLVPTARGALRARLIAEIDGTPGRSSSDLLVDVTDTRWAVLFFDRRPSWMSTFVRRAIESDARFVATSRVVTSRNVTVETGSAPGSLADLDALSLHEAIVVGAPHELTTRDVDGLEAFLRLRGGTVVLLCDERTAGPYRTASGDHAMDDRVQRSTGRASARRDGRRADSRIGTCLAGGIAGGGAGPRRNRIDRTRKDRSTPNRLAHAGWRRPRHRERRVGRVAFPDARRVVLRSLLAVDRRGRGGGRASARQRYGPSTCRQARRVDRGRGYLARRRTRRSGRRAADRRRSRRDNRTRWRADVDLTLARSRDRPAARNRARALYPWTISSRRHERRRAGGRAHRGRARCVAAHA